MTSVNSNNHMKLKIVYGSDMRLFRYPSSGKYEALLEFVSSRFPMVMAGEYSLYYVDDEGDNVTVSADEDLDEAFEVAQEENRKSLKVYINEAKVTANNQRSNSNNNNVSNVFSVPAEDEEEETGVISSNITKTKGCGDDGKADVEITEKETENSNRNAETTTDNRGDMQKICDFLRDDKVLQLLPELARRGIAAIRAEYWAPVPKPSIDENNAADDDESNANAAAPPKDLDILAIMYQVLNDNVFLPITTHAMYPEMKAFFPKVAEKIKAYLPLLMSTAEETIMSWVTVITSSLKNFDIVDMFVNNDGGGSNNSGGGCGGNSFKFPMLDNVAVHMQNMQNMPQMQMPQMPQMQLPAWMQMPQMQQQQQQQQQQQRSQPMMNPFAALMPLFGQMNMMNNQPQPQPQSAEDGAGNAAPENAEEQGVPASAATDPRAWHPAHHGRRGRGRHHWHHNHHGHGHGHHGRGGRRGQGRHGHRGGHGRYFHGCQQQQQSAGTGLANTNANLMAEVVKAVSLRDGTYYPLDTILSKTWKVRNIGQFAWGDNVQLVFEKGEESMLIEKRFPVTNVQPGGVCNVNAMIQTPSKPGRYQTFFRLQRSGDFFGPQMWVDIYAVDENGMESIEQQAILNSHCNKRRYQKKIATQKLLDSKFLNKNEKMQMKFAKKEAKLESKQLKLQAKSAHLETRLLSKLQNSSEAANHNDFRAKKRERKCMKQSKKINKQMNKLQKKMASLEQQRVQLASRMDLLSSGNNNNNNNPDNNEEVPTTTHIVVESDDEFEMIIDNGSSDEEPEQEQQQSIPAANVNENEEQIASVNAIVMADDIPEPVSAAVVVEDSNVAEVDMQVEIEVQMSEENANNPENMVIGEDFEYASQLSTIEAMGLNVDIAKVLLVAHNGQIDRVMQEMLG